MNRSYLATIFDHQRHLTRKPEHCSVRTGGNMRNRHLLRLVAVLAGTIIVAAACGEEEGGNGGGEFQAGELGAVTIAPEEPLELGVIQTITGETASLGDDQVRGIELAV